MRRTIVVTFVLLSALALGQVRDAEHSKSGPDGRRFLGAWQAVAITDTRPDGTVVPDAYLGGPPVGILIYEAAGFMCGGNMNPGRAKWADGSNGTPVELADAARGYDSYCGTYEIDEERKTVVHHVRVALVPNDVGTDLIRTYEFSGNQLKLSGTDGLKPGFKLWTYTLERATK